MREVNEITAESPEEARQTLISLVESNLELIKQQEEPNTMAFLYRLDSNAIKGFGAGDPQDQFRIMARHVLGMAPVYEAQGTDDKVPTVDAPIAALIMFMTHYLDFIQHMPMEERPSQYFTKMAFDSFTEQFSTMFPDLFPPKGN